MWTYIARDAADPSEPSQSVLKLVRHQMAEDGIDVECWLICRQAMEAEPEAGHPVRWMEMDLVDNMADVRACCPKP